MLITGIAVYNQESSDYITNVLNNNNINIPATIETAWYY